MREMVPAGGLEAAQSAARAARHARDHGDLVVHVRYLHMDGSDGGPDSPRTRFVEAVTVLPGEAVVTKYGRSAFEGTQLAELLEREAVVRVMLAGIVTEGGIETTAQSALNDGYQVCVLLDAVAGNTSAGHAEALERMTRDGVLVLRQATS